MSLKIPTGMNLVRVTGLGIGYPVPKGFERGWAQLDGDHQKYLPRKGYRIAPCPNVGSHGFNAGCPTCEPYHGAVAVDLAPERRARWRARKLAELKAEHARVGAVTRSTVTFAEWQRLTKLYAHLDREIRFYETPRPSTWGMCPWPARARHRVVRGASANSEVG